MGKSKGNKVIVRCVGKSAEEVTGSMYLITCPTGERILLDAGLYQTSSKPYEAYKINNRKFDFKPEELTAVVLSHIHSDHAHAIPKLVKGGFNGKIYTQYKTLDFFEPMLMDSAKIMGRDALMFSKRLNQDVKPIYTPEDVQPALKMLVGIKYNEEVKISDNVTLVLKSAAHIIGSSQIILYIKTPSGSVRKLTYVGDLGNTLFDQPFTEEFDPVIKTNLLIGECTYNSPLKSVKKGQRGKDLEKLESAIRETCFNKRGKVLIPTFALARTECILYYIWKMFKDDPEFKIPVIVDSPLAVKLIKCFEDNLTGQDAIIFSEMLQWKNLRLVESYEESAALVKDPTTKVILSSSGMLTQGRSVVHLQDILPRRDSTVITVGYMAEGSLGRLIKDGKKEAIKINGKYYDNRCSIVNLTSFSGHAQFEQLIQYYSNISNNGCETIALVHSDDGKLEFKKALEEKISSIGKTTRVIATTKDQVIRF